MTQAAHTHEPPFVALRDIQAALQSLGVYVAARPGALLPYRIVPGLGSPYHGHDLGFATLDDAQTLAAELPAHAAAPPVWNVTRDLVGVLRENKVAWAGGYLAARKQFYPRTGRFLGLRECNPAALHTPYTGDANRAFAAGARAYLEAVRRALRAQGNEDSTVARSDTKPGAPSTLQLPPLPRPIHHTKAGNL